MTKGQIYDLVLIVVVLVAFAVGVTVRILTFRLRRKIHANRESDV